jgi:hypothetical protein
MDLKKLLRYDKQTRIVVQPGAMALPEFVNGVTVKNSGTVDLYWDDDKIVAGDFKSLGGNLGERYTGDVTLKWIEQTPPPATVIQQATVTIKFYINDKA